MVALLSSIVAMRSPISRSAVWIAYPFSFNSLAHSVAREKGDSPFHDHASFLPSRRLSYPPCASFCFMRFFWRFAPQKKNENKKTGMAHNGPAAKSRPR